MSRPTSPAYTGLGNEPRIEHAVYTADNLSTVCVRCGAKLGTWSGLDINLERYVKCEPKKGKRNGGN